MTTITETLQGIERQRVGIEMATAEKWLLTRAECHRRDYSEEAAELERLRDGVGAILASLQDYNRGNAVVGVQWVITRLEELVPSPREGTRAAD